MMAPAPRSFASIFYAFRTPFQRVFDKSFSHPNHRPLKALKTAGFYTPKYSRIPPRYFRIYPRCFFCLAALEQASEQ